MAAPASYSGANALAVQAAFDANATQELAPAEAGNAAQSPLFITPAPKVIQFPAPAGKMSMPPATAAPAPAVAVKKKAAPQQTALDFLEAPPPQRTLRDEVPAQIYCEQTVAAPMHRFVASCVDAAMITVAFGIFAGICQAFGSGFGTGKSFWIVMAASYALIALFYGLIFAMTGRETAGMRGAGLQLITFDGLPVEGSARAVRVAATMLSFCSGGLGLIWALADEETLTWHDHISKTFPTMADAPGSALRHGRLS